MVVREGALLTAAQRLGSPDDRCAHNQYVEPDGSFSIVALVWRPGQITRIHDHITWCVFGVIQGFDLKDALQPIRNGTARLEPNDPRTRFPRFAGQNHARNLELLAALEEIAAQHGVTAAQLAIAWVASRGEDIIPLIGTKRRDRLAEALKALDLTLSGDDLASIEAAVPAAAVAGGRYAATQVATLDSERGS